MLNYLKQIGCLNYAKEGSVHNITEFYLRLDPDFYKRNTNILIQNDELVKILVTMHDLENFDKDLINYLDRYIVENLDSFCISELIEYSIFFVHFPNHHYEFLDFFKKVIYEKKLKRNLKNMSTDKKYKMYFVLYNFKMFLTPEKRKTPVNNMSNYLNSIQINTEVLRTVLETLLKNDSTNQDQLVT